MKLDPLAYLRAKERCRAVKITGNIALAIHHTDARCQHVPDPVCLLDDDALLSRHKARLLISGHSHEDTWRASLPGYPWSDSTLATAGVTTLRLSIL